MTFLDEQLDKFYLTENVEKGILQLKTKLPAITKGMESGNLFKVKSLLNTLPDASLDELMVVGNKTKNFKQHYLESKRMAKGDKTEMQKFFILLRSSLKGIQATTKDKSVVDKFLVEVEAFSKKYGSALVSGGTTVSSVMFMIGMLFDHGPKVLRLVITGYNIAAVLILVGLLLYLVKIILNIYFRLKGIK